MTLSGRADIFVSSQERICAARTSRIGGWERALIAPFWLDVRAEPHLFTRTRLQQTVVRSLTERPVSASGDPG